MLRRRRRARHVGQLSFLRTLRERAGMMNQQLLHQVSRQPQERGLLIRSARTGRAQGFDFDQLEIELVHYRGGLERVIRTLGPHARGGNPPQFGVKKLDQPARGLMVAVAKARHQSSYSIGLKRGWDRHFGTQFTRELSQKKNSKATIQSAGLLSHYGVSSL